MRPPRTKSIKIVLLVFLFLLILFGAGIGTLAYLLDKEKISAMIVSRAEKVLDRKIGIGSISYGPAGIILKKFTLHEDISPSSPVMASADALELRFALMPLLKKRFDIRNVTFRRPHLNISFDENGTSNIEHLARRIREADDSEISGSIRTVSVEGAAINLREPPEGLKPLEGAYRVSCKVYIYKDRVEIEDVKARLPENRGAITAELKVARGKTLDILGHAELEKCQLGWVYRWASGPLVYDTVSGSVSQFRITRGFVEASVKASSTLRNSSEVVFADGRCRVSPGKRTVHLSEVKGKIQNSRFVVNNLLLSFGGKPQTFKITGIEGNIGQLRLLVDFLPENLYGSVRGNLSYDRGLLSGSLTLVDAGFDLKNKVVSGINTTVNFNNNTFKNRDVEMKIFGNPCRVSFASTDSSLKKLHVNISAPAVKIVPSRMKSSAEGISINSRFAAMGRIEITRLVYEDNDFEDVKIDYTLNERSLSIDNLEAVFHGGQISGNGSVDSAESPSRASAQLKFKKIKVQDYLAKNRDFAKRFFGTAGGTLKLNFPVKNPLEGMSGRLEMSIDNGKVVNTGIQNSLGIWVKELRHKLNDLEFNKIYGNAELKGNSFIIHSFIFSAQNIRLNVKGRVDRNLVASPLNIALEFNKFFIQDMPTPAVKLSLDKYLKGGWYVIPFAIEGDVRSSKSMKRLK